MLRPKDVRAQLAVSASTLRQWSDLFRDYLSPAAQVAPEAGCAHRRYTADDVHVLARVAHLFHLGHRREEVRQLLPPPTPRDAAGWREAGDQEPERDRRLRMLEDALARERARVGSLAEQCVRYERLLEAERTANAEAQRKRVEVQRKLQVALSVNERLTQANIGLHAQVGYLERELNAPVWKRVFR